MSSRIHPSQRPRHPIRAAVLAAFAAAIIAASAIAGCSSDSPQTDPTVQDARDSIPAAVPAAGLATPKVVVPTSTLPPTSTPLPPKTQLAMGTLSPLSVDPTPTQLSPQETNVLALYQPQPGEPITWINPAHWINQPTLIKLDPSADPQEEQYWIPGQVPETMQQQQLMVQAIYYAPKQLEPPANASPFDWYPDTIRRLENAHKAIYNAIHDPLGETPPRTNIILEAFPLALFKPFRQSPLEKLRFCPPIKDQPLHEALKCHRIHIQQFEELSTDPGVYRLTIMLTPVKKSPGNRHYGAIYASGVYLHNADDPESVPVQIGETTLDYVIDEEPTGAEPPPQALVGIDPDNVAYLIRCRQDKYGYEEYVGTGNIMDTFGFAIGQPWFHPETTPQELAIIAHKRFQREPCRGYCRTGFYESEEYLELAKDLNTYLTQQEKDFSPDYPDNARTCPGRSFKPTGR